MLEAAWRRTLQASHPGINPAATQIPRLAIPITGQKAGYLTWLRPQDAFISNTRTRSCNWDSPRHTRCFTLVRYPGAKGRHHKYRTTPELQEQMIEARNSVLEPVRSAVRDEDIRTAIAAYGKVKQAVTLGKGDVYGLAQLLRVMVDRQHRVLTDPVGDEERKRSREAITEFAQFAIELVKDTRQQVLPACPTAYVHILSIFRTAGDSESLAAFWQWLKVQDDNYVKPSVYGAVISVLAYRGASLQDMEDLYAEALARFPGSFNAYHLSPLATVADREREIDVRGIPMSLLDAIMTARILRGDSKNAYLALDTALRLFPAGDLPPMFNIFLNERPIAEAYTVFMMAWRAGISIPQTKFRGLLLHLRLTLHEGVGMRQHVHVLRLMLNATYMHYTTGGNVATNLINELLIAVSSILRAPDVSNLPAKELRVVGETVLRLIRRVLELAAFWGAKPGISAFNSIITNIAGFGRMREVVGIALTDVRALGLQPTVATQRSILTAAGLLKDKTLVLEAWHSLAESQADGIDVGATDMHMLIGACVATEQQDFAKTQIAERNMHFDHEQKQGMLERLAAADDGQDTLGKPVDVDAAIAKERLDRILSDLDIIEARLRSGGRIGDLRGMPLLMSVWPPAASLPEEEMIALYDELTTEQPVHTDEQQPESLNAGADSEVGESGGPVGPKEQPPASPPTLSPTNIPYGELRYENWRSINQLLAMAHAADAAFGKAVDEALANGAAPPQRGYGLGLPEGGGGSSYGLSDVVEDAGREPTGRGGRSMPELDVPDGNGVAEQRAGILRLRGRLGGQG